MALTIRLNSETWPPREPVDEYAHEFIEKAALSWFADYRGRIARGALVHEARGDASIRQGAFTGGTQAVA